MQQYRLFFIDGAGPIWKSHEFEARDDEVAIRISDSWRDGRMELWRRDIKFKSWD